MEDELPNCTVCGKPVMYGSRHSQCGALVMELFTIAMYGDRGSQKGMVDRIEGVLRKHRAAPGVNPSDGSWPPQAMKDRLNAARERAAADYHEGRERLANAPLTGEDDAPPDA